MSALPAVLEEGSTTLCPGSRFRESAFSSPLPFFFFSFLGDWERSFSFLSFFFSFLSFFFFLSSCSSLSARAALSLASSSSSSSRTSATPSRLVNQSSPPRVTTSYSVPWSRFSPVSAAEHPASHRCTFAIFPFLPVRTRSNSSSFVPVTSKSRKGRPPSR